MMPHINRFGDDKMHYKMDPTLLPTEVLQEINRLRNVLKEHTDYIHLQVTFDDLQLDCCDPVVDVIAPNLDATK